MTILTMHISIVFVSIIMPINISISKAAKASKNLTIYMFEDLTGQLISAIETVLLTPDSFIVLGYPETKKADQAFIV